MLTNGNMKLVVEGFDWDEGNREKCQKHTLTVEEIEAFFRHAQYRLLPDIKHSATEKRLLAIGRGVNNRWMFVGFVARGNLIRPVTARYMHEKEIRNYEKEEDATL